MEGDSEPQGTASEFAADFMSLLTDDAPEAPPEPTEAVTDTAAADTDAEESPESEQSERELSAEERVAAALADGDAEEGDDAAEGEEDEPTQTASDDDDPLSGLSDEEMRQIARDALANRESDRRLRAQQIEAQVATQAQQELDRLYGEYNARLTQVRQHYFREEQRLLDQCRMEANNAPNPDLYWQQESPKVRQTVRQHEDAYVAQNLNAPYEQRMRERQEQIPREVSGALFQELKPAYIADLTAELGLNKAAIPELMKVNDPDAILARAQELVVMRDAVLAARQRDRQTTRKQAAQDVRSTTVRPPATGRPRAEKPKPLKGDESEGWLLLRGDLTA